MVTIRTLGGIDLRDSDGRQVSAILSQPQLIGLLVYLAGSETGNLHRRDTLIDLMWPGTPETQARRRLNQTLYELRRALGNHVVTSRGKEEVGIPAGVLQSDLDAFRLAVRAGRREEALGLYGGPFLGRFCVPHAPGIERWIDLERGALRRAALAAASTLSDDLHGRGDLTGALFWARRACQIEPQNEPSVRALMVILRLIGDRTRALEVFDNFRDHLAYAYELKPSAETQDLAAEIRPEPDGDGAR